MEKQLIEDHAYYQAYLNPESQVMDIIWKLSTESMEDQAFRAVLAQFVEYVKEHSLKGYFVDTRESRFTVILETQTWHDEVIAPQYLEAGLYKMAFLVGEDLLSNISHEQAFEEPNSRQLNVRFFEDAEEAYTWLEEESTLA